MGRVQLAAHAQYLGTLARKHERRLGPWPDRAACVQVGEGAEQLVAVGAHDDGTLAERGAPAEGPAHVERIGVGMSA